MYLPGSSTGSYTETSNCPEEERKEGGEIQCGKWKVRRRRKTTRRRNRIWKVEGKKEEENDEEEE